MPGTTGCDATWALWQKKDVAVTVLFEIRHVVISRNT